MQLNFCLKIQGESNKRQGKNQSENPLRKLHLGLWVNGNEVMYRDSQPQNYAKDGISDAGWRESTKDGSSDSAAGEVSGLHIVKFVFFFVRFFYDMLDSLILQANSHRHILQDCPLAS